MNMRVAILCPYAENRPYGGVAGVAYDTIEGFKQLHSRLEEEDIHIHVLSLRGSSYSMCTKVTEYSNIHVHYFKPLYPFSFFGDLQYNAYLRKIGGINLLHSHDITGACCGVLTSRPTILTLHGITWKEKNHSFQLSQKIQQNIGTIRLKFAYKRLQCLIAISPYVYDEIYSEISTDTKKLTLIENPVSNIFFDVEKAKYDNLILYPGVINPRKNQIGAVHALNILQRSDIDAHLVFTGSVGDSDYYKKLVNTIESYGLQSKVTITGQISLENLIEFYSKASLILLLSRQETAPMVVSESMATGTPVIASNIAGIPYMINNGRTGFTVDPDAITQIADKITLLLEDKKLNDNMGRAAKNEAYNRWNSKAIANKLLDTYVSHSS